MKIRKNILLFKLYYLLADMWPLSVLAIVYFQQIFGSYAFALGVFSIANIVQSIAEVPTGIISDRIGRRKTMILASVITTIAFILFSVAGTFGYKYLLILGGIIWAIAVYARLNLSPVRNSMQKATNEIFKLSLFFADVLYALTNCHHTDY